MRYLSCLIEEADMLFRRDTREDINEARQLYLLAAEILGEKHELGPDEQTMTFFIRPDNWDSLKKGLEAGNLLQAQLRQMESAHMAANKRELEMTKHVSLFQLDPASLLALRQTGSCEIHIPEVLYAVDFPAHYYRRIKSVRVTIPCVVGPYANVSATLTLLNSWTRRTTCTSAIRRAMVARTSRQASIRAWSRP